MESTETQQAERWRARPVAAWCIRVVASAVPFAASVAAGVVAARLLPQPAGAGAALWWAVVFAASMLALYGTERAARRWLSLSMLLNLSLAFPDAAPSRFAVALRSGSLRRLRSWAQGAPAATDVGERLESVLTLAAALNAHDRRTRGHSERVRALTDLLADEMRLPAEDVDRLRWAALLHDIGKLSVPASILNKPGKPDAREWAVLQRHPAEGERIAAGLYEWLGDWGAAIHAHHERWDGCGYPRGLPASEIPLSARIVAVTDSFETMTALRSYKQPMSAEKARAELTRCSGGQFDPEVVRSFLSISIPRLNRKIGFLAWLAQVPVLGVMPRAAAQMVTTGAAAGAASPQLVAAASVALTSVTAPVGVAAAAVIDDVTPVRAPVVASHAPAADVLERAAPAGLADDGRVAAAPLADAAPAVGVDGDGGDAEGPAASDQGHEASDDNGAGSRANRGRDEQAADAPGRGAAADPGTRGATGTARGGSSSTPAAGVTGPPAAPGAPADAGPPAQPGEQANAQPDGVPAPPENPGPPEGAPAATPAAPGGGPATGAADGGGPAGSQSPADGASGNTPDTGPPASDGTPGSRNANPGRGARR